VVYLNLAGHKKHLQICKLNWSYILMEGIIWSHVGSIVLKLREFFPLYTFHFRLKYVCALIENQEGYGYGF